VRAAPAVVLDWDGTVTVGDSLNLALQQFGDPEVYARAEGALGRGMTLKDVIELEFSGVRAPLEDVVAWMLENVRVRGGFHELAQRYRPLILSSSFVETIEPLLERERVRLEVRANRVEARPDGWRVHWNYFGNTRSKSRPHGRDWRDDTVCDHCDEACKRAGLPTARPLVFVGDGYSDRCAALAADRVFARDGLARYLDERGVAYEPFEDLHDVLVALDTL
jgi:2-hydroxy-3-keto-5-methylthiopentenyl-1-phosphate phosphatase